jgi:hypothetical protein
VAKSCDDNVDGARDLRQSAGYGGSNGRILLIDETDDLEGRHAVEIGGGGQDLFRGESAKIGFRFAGSGQLMRLSEYVESRTFYYVAETRAVMRWIHSLGRVSRAFA